MPSSIENFVTRYIRSYKKAPQSLNPTGSATRLYIDCSKDSQQAFKAMVKNDQTFEPTVATKDAPYADFGGMRYYGVDKIASLAACLGNVDEAYRKRIKELIPHNINADSDEAKKLMLDKALTWAYTEAVVEGRPMTQLPQKYQNRDEIRHMAFFNALGEALVEQRPLTYLGDENQPV
jgi:hypothetical protein